jgi:PAS domain S-box-containing protein
LNLRLFNRIVRQVLIFPVLALVLVAAALYWQINSSTQTVDRIQDSDEAISQTNLIGRLIIDEESGLRGYVATSDIRFLDPYTKAIAQLPSAFDTLMSLKLDEPEKKKVAQLRADHDIWRESFALPLIAETMARDGAQMDTRDITLNLQGKALLDIVRFDLQALVKANEEHRTRRVTRWRTQLREMVLGLLALAVTMGIFIGLFTRGRLHVVSNAYQTSVDTLSHKNEELFLSEQQLRTTLASIGDAVITCDADGQIRMMNQVASDLTGWPMEEALGRSLDSVLHLLSGSTRALVEDPVAKVKRLNKIVALAEDTILVRRDGTELNIDDSGAPIRDQDGKITGVVLVFRDVTVARRTQQALISNEKLAVAGRLAASIAHEIHNPLDSISNMLYLMGPNSTEEENAQFLAMAQQEIARVTQISRSMLSLYRESTAPVPVNIKEILDGTLVLLDHRIDELESTVAVSVPPDLCVAGYPAELRQVFTNLVVNAIEAAGPSGHIEVKAEHLAPSSTSGGERREDGVQVEIVDNGPGISETHSPNLFQPFFSTKGEQGTGLGLWVSRGIIRKHGGAITLESRKDNPGAVARVFLATNPVISPGAD